MSRSRSGLRHLVCKQSDVSGATPGVGTWPTSFGANTKQKLYVDGDLATKQIIAAESLQSKQ